MLNTFEFSGYTKIAYGQGLIESFGADFKKNIGDARKVLLITDPGLVQNGLMDTVKKALNNDGVNVEVFSDIQSDPSSKSIDAAIETVKDFGTECVIGLGGGSPMDVAKITAALAGGDHGVEHYELMKNPFPQKVVKCIAIPTTSGTGAEVTRTAVYTNSAGHKVWAWDDAIAAELAILEPTFTAGLPPHLTAATGMDALVHAIESCIDKTSNPITRGFGLQAIRMIAGNLEKVIAKPDDLEGRGNMAIASTLAGLGINQVSTCIAHCLGHALGSLGRIHHGRAVAISQNVAYAWNVEAAVPIHAEISRALGVKDCGQDEKELALAGAVEFDRLLHAIGINTSLTEDGLTTSDTDRFLELILSSENAPMRESNPRWATEEDLKRFVQEILK
ncbi:MAG: iron-containing alcohol dehydrogenase [Desulfobacterales bacterium]|nr:iron-containing alcohol dehydrogenase [Desulfobacterales bacterium]